MKIITDCIYLPAQKPPKACQDYAICSEECDNYKFLLICDGCGSSKDTDIGARLLAHGAKSFFNKLVRNGNKIDYRDFGLASIVNASVASKVLEVKEQCLDATLIFSFIDNDSVETLMYGDGFLFGTGKDGKLNYYNRISYFGNAPHYLSYNLNQERYGRYKSGNVRPVEFDLGIISEVSNNLTIIKDDLTLAADLNFHRDLEKSESIIISSDGIESFVDITTGERIPHEEVIKEIIDFKNKKGEFIKRRVRRMMENFAKKGIYNYDDVSIAAFMILEE
jgi:hypothetical protein